jgi:hypothetical protein
LERVTGGPLLWRMGMSEIVGRWRFRVLFVMLVVLFGSLLVRPSPAICSASEQWGIEDAGGCDANWVD